MAVDNNSNISINTYKMYSADSLADTYVYINECNDNTGSTKNESKCILTNTKSIMLLDFTQITDNSITSLSDRVIAAISGGYYIYPSQCEVIKAKHYEIGGQDENGNSLMIESECIQYYNYIYDKSQYTIDKRTNLPLIPIECYDAPNNGDDDSDGNGQSSRPYVCGCINTISAIALFNEDVALCIQSSNNINTKLVYYNNAILSVGTMTINMYYAQSCIWEVHLDTTYLSNNSGCIGNISYYNLYADHGQSMAINAHQYLSDYYSDLLPIVNSTTTWNTYTMDIVTEVPDINANINTDDTVPRTCLLYGNINDYSFTSSYSTNNMDDYCTQSNLCNALCNNNWLNSNLSLGI